MAVRTFIPAEVVQEKDKQCIGIDMGKAGIVRCIMKQIRPIGNKEAGYERHFLREMSVFDQ